MFKKYTFLILIVSLCFACSTTFKVQDGQTAYSLKQYALAADLYAQEYEKHTTQIKKAAVAFKVADSYDKVNKPEKAAEWFQKAYDNGYGPEAILNLALQEKKQGKYSEAAKHFEQVEKFNPNLRQKARAEIRSCLKAQQWINEPLEGVSVENVSAINSSNSDYSPASYKNGLVFSSDRKSATGEAVYGWTGNAFSDLFFSSGEKADFATVDNWQQAINTAGNEGTATFNNNQTVVYFTRCDVTENTSKGFCKIYKSTRTGEQWNTPTLVPLMNDSVNVAHPFLSPNENRLYFTADGNQGFGGKDIYYATDVYGKWSEPANAGREINTIEDEGFPFISKAGDFYFASKGHENMGGYDVFVCKKEGKGFKKAENIKSPYNSEADDFGFIMTNTNMEDSVLSNGYLTSSRTGGKGADDIYYYEERIVPEPIIPAIVYEFNLIGIVKEKEFTIANDPNSKVKGLVNLKDVSVNIKGTNMDSTFNYNGEGTFTIKLQEDSEYEIFAQKDGYLNQRKYVNTIGQKDENNPIKNIEVELVLDKIFAEKEITLDNIYYDLDKADIRIDAQPVLNQLAIILIENPKINIEIGSHTDSRGTDSYNLKLSQRRAESVINYLAQQGVEKGRLTAKGYGETSLINECANGIPCEEAQHQENRRTTFKILE